MMPRIICALAFWFSCLASAHAAVRIDTSAARATLNALNDSQLTRAEALAVADLPGNVAVILKANHMGSPATRETFADALVAAAHREAHPTPFGFGRVRENGAVTLALLDRIEREPTAFRDWITRRVARFTPAGLDADVTGYLVAGGPSDGYSFDKPDFYLNVAHFGDDIEGVRVIMAHELYHAVQNAAQARRPKGMVFSYDAKRYNALPIGLARQCYATRALFGYLVAEGTASYVGDAALLPKTGVYSAAERERRAGEFGSVTRQRTLLDMSFLAITAPEPISLDDVYAVGFYTPAELYDVGYVMSKAIAEQDGDAALGLYIDQPGDVFVRRYIALTMKAGSKLPKLGPATVRWAQRADCLS